MHDWPPSLLWAEEHCKAKSAYLDDWSVSGATLQHLFVAGTRTNEPTLSARLMDGPLDSEACAQMVGEVATGLQALHDMGLVHGRISLDAIQCTSVGAYRLLRDPLFPPASAYGVGTPSVLGGEQDRFAVSAPELARSGAKPTVQSDLYALGCVWYRALTGQWPFQPGIDAPPTKWSVLHAQIPVLMPDGLKEPLAKCLMHLLAKSPTVRFRKANDLLDALRIALTSTTKKETVGEVSPVDVATPSPGKSIPKTADSKSGEWKSSPSEVDGGKAITSGEKPIGTSESVTRNPNAMRAAEESGRASKGSSSEQSPTRVKKSVAASVQNAALTSDPAIKAAVGDAARDIDPAVTPPLVEISNPLLGASKPSLDASSNGQGVSDTPSGPVGESKSGGSVSGGSKSGGSVESKPEGSQDVPVGGADKGLGSGTGKPTIVLDKLNALDVKEVGAKKKKKKPRSKDGEAKGKKVAEVGSKGVKGKRKTKRPVWFMPLMFICSLLMMLLLVLVLRNTSVGVVKIKPQERNQGAVAQNEKVVPSVANGAGKERVAIDPMLEYFALKEDDGKSPWTPPTIGSPYSTDMLPMGIETLVFLSGAAIEPKKPADQLLQWWQGVQGNASSIPEFAWVNREGLDSVAIAWYPGAEISTFQRVVRFTYSDSKPLSERIVASESMEPKKVTSESGPSQTFWIAPVDGQQVAFAGEELRSDANASVRRVTVGPVGLIEQLAKNQGKSGPLRRQMEVLLQATDSRADVTVLAAPSFLYGDGKLLMGEHSGRVLSLLRSFVDDNVQALLIRTHLEPAWYVEVRTLGNDLQSAFRDAAEAKKRLEGLPDEMEARFTAKPADPYWRALANRYPQMLRKLVSYTRAASEDGQVVINAYLPSEAVLNMTISSWMALQADSGATTSKVAVAKPTPSASKTPDELLEAKINIKLEQESLEAVLLAISNEVRDSHTGGVEALPMAINGGAFQKEGITRNQQIRGFDFKETPLREVLTALARRANPVTTVKAPNEKDQKVVWVLIDDPATPSKKKLEMTTRVWAASNQANLPTEFVIPKD